MNTEDNDIEIELSADAKTPEELAIIVEKAEDKPVAPAADDVTEQLAKLKEQLNSEQRNRQLAEERANNLAQAAHSSQAEAQDANLHLLANAIAAVESQNENIKIQYRQAVAEGDADAMADLQMAMATNAAKLARLEDGKLSLESAPKVEAPRPIISDQAEAMAQSMIAANSPRSAAWIRAHPEYATDQNKTVKMIAAHNLATADGLIPDTDAYFAAIEDTLRIRREAPVAPAADAMADAATVTQRRTSPPAAPVSRSGGAPGTSPNRVTLSREEREMASMMGMSDAEYAKNKLALRNEGRLQ